MPEHLHPFFSTEKVAVQNTGELPGLHGKTLILIGRDNSSQTGVVSVTTGDYDETHVSVKYAAGTESPGGDGLPASSGKNQKDAEFFVYLTQAGLDSILRKEGDLQLDTRDQLTVDKPS